MESLVHQPRVASRNTSRTERLTARIPPAVPAGAILNAAMLANSDRLATKIAPCARADWPLLAGCGPNQLLDGMSNRVDVPARQATVPGEYDLTPEKLVQPGQ